MGFLSDDENSDLKEPIPWKEATQKILGASSDKEQDLIAAIASKTNIKSNEQSEQLLAGLRWIGLVSTLYIINIFCCVSQSQQHSWRVILISWV